MICHSLEKEDRIFKCQLVLTFDTGGPMFSYRKSVGEHISRRHIYKGGRSTCWISKACPGPLHRLGVSTKVACRARYYRLDSRVPGELYPLRGGRL